jgi:hypothetical protein
MNWTKAESLLRNNIKWCSKLDEGNYLYKIVISTPPDSGNKNEESGFRVKVGKNSIIKVSLKMLEDIFEASRKNDNLYNNSVFKNLYARKLSSKPCYVHTVGKLFENAGIAKKINNRTYQIL